MKLSEYQYIEAAFLFEKENGNKHGNFEKEIIRKSNLLHLKLSELQTIIVEGLNSDIYLQISERNNAYWALSKTNDKTLIPLYKEWLKKELASKNSTPIFQILIALDRLDEPAFHKDRNSRYYDDIELNIRDAKNYLENN